MTTVWVESTVQLQGGFSPIAINIFPEMKETTIIGWVLTVTPDSNNNRQVTDLTTLEGQSLNNRRGQRWKNGYTIMPSPVRSNLES